MRLSPRELEGLLIHQTGFLAQKRLARGLKLNLPESVALIASQVKMKCVHVKALVRNLICLPVDDN